MCESSRTKQPDNNHRLSSGCLLQSVELPAADLLNAQGVGLALFAVEAVVGDEPVAIITPNQVTEFVQQNQCSCAAAAGREVTHVRGKLAHRICAALIERAIDVDHRLLEESIGDAGFGVANQQRVPHHLKGHFAQERLRLNACNEFVEHGRRSAWSTVEITARVLTAENFEDVRVSPGEIEISLRELQTAW